MKLELYIEYSEIELVNEKVWSVFCEDFGEQNAYYLSLNEAIKFAINERLSGDWEEGANICIMRGKEI